MSPAKMAEQIRKWREAGFDVAIVDAGIATIEADRNEARSRAPRRSGALAGTIRVIRPSSTAAARRGYVRLALAAGSRAMGNPVRYASVLQTGTVGYPARERTKAHPISPQGGGATLRVSGRRAVLRENSSHTVLRLKVPGGNVFVARVKNHPGSKFQALNYLQVNEARAVTIIGAGVAKALQQATEG